MKRLWCWMLLSVACALPAAAQNLTLKVGGGLASHYKDSRPVGAFKLGLGYEFELDQHWTVEPSLVFYGKGWKEPDEQVAIRDDEGEQIYDEEGNPLVGVRLPPTISSCLSSYTIISARTTTSMSTFTPGLMWLAASAER